MRVGITGAHGLIGWHVRCHLSATTDYEIVAAGREEFSSAGELDGFTGRCDVILHFAGMNRGADDETLATNVGLAEQLIASFERNNATPLVVFSSSTHIDKDSAYGTSKRDAAARFAEWSERSGAVFTNLVLPHVFGEHGKPFYNSVVSTFCHQLVNGETPSVESDAQLSLLHAQDVGQWVAGEIAHPQGGEQRPRGEAITVAGLLEELAGMARQYASGVIPDLGDPVRCRLFNTYRSYLYPDSYPIVLQLHVDERGNLFEAVKGPGGGQAFLSTTKPGITRGNHYHLRKFERFLVTQGEATIEVRRLFSDQKQVFTVNGDAPSAVDIPTLHTHNITNTGDSDLVTLFWTNEIFNPDDPDTYFEKV